ncbi:unnamed protein product [Staurois parvus]|uniref:Uncharacterized protein n=1 Tax=Staurois parvus TaxID=386267 RepID=A0ABN9BAP7_9NEOB|nr:unnamed protein product [Staurois parvus]
MIGTSYRGPVRRSVFHCVRRTQRAPDHGAARSQGARTSRHFSMAGRMQPERRRNKNVKKVLKNYNFWL